VLDYTMPSLQISLPKGLVRISKSGIPHSVNKEALTKRDKGCAEAVDVCACAL